MEKNKVSANNLLVVTSHIRFHCIFDLTPRYWGFSTVLKTMRFCKRVKKILYIHWLRLLSSSLKRLSMRQYFDSIDSTIATKNVCFENTIKIWDGEKCGSDNNRKRLLLFDLCFIWEFYFSRSIDIVISKRLLFRHLGTSKLKRLDHTLFVRKVFIENYNWTLLEKIKELIWCNKPFVVNN